MNKIIKSKENKNAKLLKKLSTRKYREEFKLFKVENIRVIYDALKGGYDFKSLFVTEEFTLKNKEEYEFLKKSTKDGEVFIVDEKVNKYYSDLDSISGITAVYNTKEKNLDNAKSVIYLNGVGDPGNVGAIIRTMLAFGFSNLVLDEECADIYNSKTISASREAIFKINIIKDKNKEWISNCDLLIYCADSNGGEDLDSIKVDKKLCLVLGSEGTGIDKEILKLAKKNIKISITNEVESLNVGIAAGIILNRFKNIIQNYYQHTAKAFKLLVASPRLSYLYDLSVFCL